MLALTKTLLLVGLVFTNLLSSSASAYRSCDLNESEFREALHLMASLGYWTGDAEVTSDKEVYYATLAFQRVVGLKATGQLSPTELRLLRVGQPVKPRSSEFYHIEVDVSRQILFVVEADGVVRWILPISTGNGKPFPFKGHTETGRTPVGTFEVYRKIDGWRDSPLGLMYYPSYIYRGIAIHGSPVFAIAPSTHGCISVPAEAAISLSKLMPMGTVVMVYR